MADAEPFSGDCFDILEVGHGATGGKCVPRRIREDNVSKPEREGRPESSDGRGGTESTENSAGGGEGAPEVRRRRVVLHQGLPDPAEPKGV